MPIRFFLYFVECLQGHQLKHAFSLILLFHTYLLHFLSMAPENCFYVFQYIVMSHVVEQRSLANHLYKYTNNTCSFQMLGKGKASSTLSPR